jgi:hypothetical protein
MLPIRRSTSASASWLVRHVENMARKLGASKLSGAASRKILEGYLLEARKTGKVLKVTILDLPAFLLLVGRYIPQSQALNRDRSFVQTLAQGRDAYLPGKLTALLDPRLEPLVLAGPLNTIRLGVPTGYESVSPTRYWGQGVPFTGVGMIHAYSAVRGGAPRWPMSYAINGEPFVWRLVIEAPTVVRWVTTEGETVQAPASPQSAASGWTLEIGEQVLNGGAQAITRLLDAPTVDYELNWEAAQYPWIVAGRPKAFTTQTGDPGFRITVACHVTYEAAGPYYWYDTPDRPVDPGGGGGSWSEGSNGISNPGGGVPSGAKGLWAADIEVVGATARVVESYRVFGGALAREPLFRDRTRFGATGTWYLNNLTYRAPMSTVENEDGTRTSIMISATFVERSADWYTFGADPAFTSKPFEGSLFVDVTWFDKGAVRRQNVTTTELKRGVFHAGVGEAPYNGTNVAFDIGEADEDRFTIGSDTDGTSVVFPVFSAFKPGEKPRLRVYVATRDAVALRYTGKPGFAMCVACATGEQMIYNYGVVDRPLTGDSQYGEWITLPAPFDHVTYIGNNRFMFYVSREISERPADNFFWAPAGSIGVATYNLATDEVRFEGTIDAQLVSNGFGAEAPYSAYDAWFYVSETSAYTVPVFANSAKLGRIEVLRPESDGYNPADENTQGHPATLIATRGKGQPGLNLVQWDNDDITQGRTWISYDSGKSWTLIMDYGSPVGVFHAGNAAQARTEPIVRV